MGCVRRLGFHDATLTSPGADRGLDVVATGAAAQVKALASPVGRPDVQRLVGAGINAGQLLFFSLSGYSARAIEYADDADVALFTFDRQLHPFAVNEFAQVLVDLAAGQQPVSGQASCRATASWPSKGPAGWRGWPVPAKVLAAMTAFVLATVVGPVVFAVGRLAMRRAGQPFGASDADEMTRRRGAVVIAGVLGTVLLGSVAVQNLWWGIFGGQPEDGSPGVGAIIGIAVGVAALVAINAVVASGRLDRVPLPKALGSEAPQAR